MRRLLRLTVRHLPWLVAIATALVTFVCIRATANSEVRLLREREHNGVERALEQRAADIMAARLKGGAMPEDNAAWFIDRKKHTSSPVAKPDLEPPFFNLAENAKDDPQYDEFEQRGSRFETYTRPIGETESLLVIQDINWLPGRLRDLAQRPRRGLIISTLLAAAAAWIATRLLLRPAKRALAHRQDFLADAAHELRTPLAIIQASAGHALSRPRTSEEYVRSMAEIRSAAERAGSGVAELLDLARFEAGQAVPRLAPLRLDLLAEEVAASSRFDDCTVRTEVGPSVVVDADMALLRQAIDNVVRNAAARATHVVLTTSADGRDGVLTVADDGPGFGAETKPYVFERFRRADQNGSSGLGLPIVAAILAAHGGTAEADNATDGGAVVRLRVPRSRSHL